jgi:zinc protease
MSRRRWRWSGEYFGKIPKPERKLMPTYTQEPTQDGERLITLRRTGDVQLVSCAFRTVAGSHDDDAPLSVLATLMSDAPFGPSLQGARRNEESRQRFR